MIKLILMICVLNITCKKPNPPIDSCNLLNQKLRTEWKYDGKLQFKEQGSDWEFYYYKDGLNISELFQDPKYHNCFTKYTYDSIVKILGKPYNYLPNQFAHFFIEKPILDSPGRGTTIFIGFDEQGYIDDITKGKSQSID
jgi:hypothetical protein